ncbi:hypothetical protein C8R47DRAFT_515757 [Mycena vitilis]|nr:hypothetical protein C8R47DRAFT_515757 [Mycena vitilis]
MMVRSVCADSGGAHWQYLNSPRACTRPAYRTPAISCARPSTGTAHRAPQPRQVHSGAISERLSVAGGGLRSSTGAGAGSQQCNTRIAREVRKGRAPLQPEAEARHVELHGIRGEVAIVGCGRSARLRARRSGGMPSTSSLLGESRPYSIFSASIAVKKRRSAAHRCLPEFNDQGKELDSVGSAIWYHKNVLWMDAQSDCSSHCR